MVVQAWAKSLNVSLTGRRFRSSFVRTVFQEKEVILLCPQTYMNLSGLALKECTDFFKVKNENILVVHDDLDLAIGRIKTARNGGAGGHKGILSIFESLGTREFSRLKVGIGRPCFSEPVEDFVLKPFYPEHRPLVEKVIGLALQACEIFVVEGIGKTMSRINSQDLTGTIGGGLCGREGCD
jgi:PTH1 family peptidyl-tRNA hydrolase